ncbi:MAG TPA: glycosyltransferase family 2 protein [Chitinophagaceae bacterium]|nr:glycosyltransferase family 2 protein [Chitinophagaceae bacterium]
MHAMLTHIDPKNVFVIVPAYNEDEIIQSVIKELLPYNYTLVIVDDGSSRNLYSLIKNLPVYILRHAINMGQGAALQTGIEFALSKNAEYIVTFDSDGQHAADDIDKLLEAFSDNDVDVVLGSRFINGSAHNITIKRKLLLKIARYLNYFFTGLLLTDAHNGLRAMNRIAASSIRLQENRMAHATEILAQIKKAKLRFKEVPVHVYYTDYSKRKGQSAWNSFRIFFDVLLNKIFG